MSDLKPCPFCGEEAEIVNAYTALRRYRAACRDCGSWGRCGDTIEAAVAHWNTRADSAALAAAVHAEREAIKAHIDSDAFMPSEWAQRQPLDVYDWERGVADVMTYIDSRGPAPAVNVMAVVREFVYAFDAARSAFEDESVVDDAYVEAENRSEKAWAALRALVDDSPKAEAKPIDPLPVKVREFIAELDETHEARLTKRLFAMVDELRALAFKAEAKDGGAEG